MVGNAADLWLQQRDNVVGVWERRLGVVLQSGVLGMLKIRCFEQLSGDAEGRCYSNTPSVIPAAVTLPVRKGSVKRPRRDCERGPLQLRAVALALRREITSQ